MKQMKCKLFIWFCPQCGRFCCISRRCEHSVTLFICTVAQIQTFHTLKVSNDVAKKNIILCICCNAMCLCGLRLKNTLFST